MLENKTKAKTKSFKANHKAMFPNFMWGGKSFYKSAFSKFCAYMSQMLYAGQSDREDVTFFSDF